MIRVRSPRVGLVGADRKDQKSEVEWLGAIRNLEEAERKGLLRIVSRTENKIRAELIK